MIIRAKYLKDAFCRYQTMQGHKVLRKVGWDTHGLPVEVNDIADAGGNVKEGIPASEAEELKAKLEEAGATVELA